MSEEVIPCVIQFIMASATPKSEGTPTPPTFSYAMAAKGRATSTTNSTMQSSQASTSGVSTPAKESNSVSNTPSASVNGAAASENGDRNISGATEALSKSDPLGVGINTDAKPTAQVTTGSNPASPTVDAAPSTTIPKEEELALNGNADASEQGWEKAGRSREEKPSAEASEARKPKKSKKQKKDDREVEKEKEKEKEEVKVPEVPLVPAPPPAVNFWEQRKEAAAKTKSSPSISQTANSLGESTSTTTKTTDSRRKGKSSTDDEKTSQSGKDTASNKGQKKGPDGLIKGKDDSSKRPARGSRSSDEKDKSAVSPVPPPVEDSMAWPTPETAIEEEKRKIQEEDKAKKEEKDENSFKQPRTKEKWVPVPYTPSVTFNTPLPVRGGRGRGGARVGREGGRTSHVTNGATGEKLTGDVAKPAESDEKRGGRSSSLPPNSSKRLSNEDDVSRDPRKQMTTSSAEKAKGSANKNEPVSPTDTGRSSIATQTDKEVQTGQKGQGVGEGQFQARSGFAERRNDGSGSSSHNGSKDVRTEGRSERGRGGYRGRGSHNNFPNGQHAFANGHGAIPPYQGRQNSIPYSPPPQGPFSHQYTQTPPRGRGSTRSQSISNAAMYPRGGYANGSQQMAPLQTMYDYVPVQQPMSAMPYASFADSQAVSVLSMVKMQLEYYLSIDNLCRDVYLRKHMDSQGFVFLHFVAEFKRIQSLTRDIDMLKYACQQSTEIEIVKGEDGVDRIRRRDGWEQWVMPSEQRDESMKNNNGPTTLIRDNHGPPSHMGQMMMPGQEMGPGGNEFMGYGNGAPQANGNGHHYHGDTPLSAAVPNFTPGLLPLNGNTIPSPDPLASETTFTDEQVENLNLVFAQASHKTSDQKPARHPYHNSSSRTFSNGSIDGRSINDELYEERQGRPLVNGSHSQER